MDRLKLLLRQAMSFRVSPDGESLPITIEKRGTGAASDDVWVIKFGSSAIMAADGRIADHEPSPSYRTERFLELFRYDLDHAIDLCNQYDLWNARWVQLKGYVSGQFTLLDAEKVGPEEYREEFGWR